MLSDSAVIEQLEYLIHQCRDELDTRLTMDKPSGNVPYPNLAFFFILTDELLHISVNVKQ